MSPIAALTYKDEQYPKLLTQIPDFPPRLYYRGKLPPTDALCLGVVGSRKMTAYGQVVTAELVGPLARAGLVIVSGLAYGIDATAHRTALDTRGCTIAILGCGLDDATIYPRSHVRLAHEIIAAGGALLSEYPPGTPAYKANFAKRNRIISGLSAGVLVIECDIESGALITARHAVDQSRLLYAVPGSIHAQASRGPNHLLKKGVALAVTEAKDILQDLNIPVTVAVSSNSTASLDPAEQSIMQCLSSAPLLIDQIIQITGLDPAKTTSTLALLEIKGLVQKVGAQQYSILNKG
jgi:DNA processing protein